MVLPMWTMSTVMPWSKRSHGCSCQGCKATNHTAELSRTFRTLPPEPTPRHTGTLGNLRSRLPTPAHTGTLRNFPEPSKLTSWTYASIHRNPPKSSGTVRNLPLEPTPFYRGTLRNLPEPASGSYTSTHGNSPEPSGTFQDLPEPTFRNLRQQTPEPSGTFRNLPLRNLPAPGTYTSIRRNLPEPSEPASGAYTSTRRNPPEPSGTSFRNLLLRPAPAHTGAYLGWRPQ